MQAVGAKSGAVPCVLGTALCFDYVKDEGHTDRSAWKL